MIQEIQCPLVALCGDAVADPNWLLGVGLQRGWNTALDACFYADNLYNNKTFNGKPPDPEEPITEPVEWSEHLDNLMNLIQELGNASRESKLSDEMDTGMLDEKGPVVMQLKRDLKARGVEAPVPQYLPPVEPWPRYKCFSLQVKKPYKGKELLSRTHPLAVRELAIFERNNRWVDQGAAIKKRVTRPTAAMLTWPKRFECSAFWDSPRMRLLEIDGKNPPGVEPLGESKAPSPVKAPAPAPEPEPEPEKEEEPPKPAFNADEVKQKASRKSMRLRDSIVEMAMAGPKAGGVHAPSGLDALIFKQKKTFEKEEEEAPAAAAAASTPRKAAQPDFPPSSDRRASLTSPQYKRQSLLTNEDMDAITNLTKQLNVSSHGGGAIGTGDPLYEVRAQQLKCEQATLQAKLGYEMAQVDLAAAEKAAASAKQAYAEKQVEMTQKILKAYQAAEAKMKGV